MSIGFVDHEPVIANALEEVAGQVLVFAAVSNQGANAGKQSVTFPARRDEYVIGIGSATGDGKKSDFTPDHRPRSRTNFSALGEAVEPRWPALLKDGKRRFLTGSSFATPVAAAIAALILEFAQQGPLSKIPNREMLKQIGGMREVLQAMSKESDGYYFITPWILLSTFFRKYKNWTTIAQKISDILDGV